MLGGEGFAKTMLGKSSNCGETELWPCWLLDRPLTRELGAFASGSGVNCSVVEVVRSRRQKFRLWYSSGDVT